MIYRGISFSLQSQYDAQAIPEFHPPSVAATPSPSKTERISSFAPTSPRTAECYVPAYPSSQLWIHYDCPNPEDTQTPDMRFFYFKLFVGGQCMLSWGIGQEDAWSGRTTYGIFRGESEFGAHGILEKRAFFFKKGEEVERDPQSFEIRVFRSKGRKREVAKYHNFEGPARGAFKWNNAGRMRKTEPRRMFSYALIDAVDEPYATFRYHIRTIDQLERLGFDLSGNGQLQEFQIALPDPESPASVLSRSPPAPAVPKDSLSAARRLSFPPRLHLAPSIPRLDFDSPVKKHSDQAESGDLQAFDTPKEPIEKGPSPEKKPPQGIEEVKQSADEKRASEEKQSGEDKRVAEGDRPTKEIPGQRPMSFSKRPLPTVPNTQKRGPTPPPHPTAPVSNRAGSLRGLASRLKRRSNSREEKGIFGNF